MIINTQAPKNKILGIIFDLDGTLINSEQNYYESERLILSKYGVNFTFEDKKKYMGVGYKDFTESIKKIYDINETQENLILQMKTLYLELAEKNTELFPIMKDFINILKSKEYPMSIATGSSKEILNILLKKLNINDFFKYIVSSDEVSSGKPSPEIFLETAKRMNIDPKNILVFEDSKNGVEAALNAKMNLIALPMPQDNLNTVFYKSDILFEKGIDKFDINKILQWINK
jgi:HAD superfamily hydrolase (TIGR01509 family)